MSSPTVHVCPKTIENFENREHCHCPFALCKNADVILVSWVFSPLGIFDGYLDVKLLAGFRNAQVWAK